MATTTPVTNVCPSCGGRDYTKVSAAAKGSLTKDRSCNRCGTRYSPPAPLWVILAMWGILLCLPGYFLLTAENPGDVRGSMWLAFTLSVGFIAGLVNRVVRERRQPSRNNQ
jgi:hypothetical protein